MGQSIGRTGALAELDAIGGVGPIPQLPQQVPQQSWGQQNANKLMALGGIIGGMAHRPNQAVQRLGQYGLQMEQVKKQGNATVAYLRQRGHDDLAQLVESNPTMAREALKQSYERDKPRSQVVLGRDLGLEGLDEGLMNSPFVVSPDGDTKMLGGRPAAGTTVNVGDQISPGFKKYSETVGTSVADWQQTGRSDAYAQLAQMTDAISALESGEAKTGLVYGSLPEWGKAWYDGNTKQAQDQIEEVVQRNLRTILGAQFTEREGTRLIARAFNDKLTPEQNLQRLRKLMTQMQAAADAKDQMSAYFMENEGDMRGFKGAVPSLQSFHDAFDAMDAAQGVAAVRVSSQEQFNALPSGAEYISTDGKRYRKP